MDTKNFDNLDFNIRFFFRQIVTEKNISPINFFFQSQDLQLFLSKHYKVNKQYCEELIYRFSPDQFTNLDIDRFKIMMNNIMNSCFPFMQNLNFSTNGFLIPDQQTIQSIILESLLHRFDISKIFQQNNYSTFDFVNQNLQKFAIEYLYEQEEIKKAQENFEQQFIEIEQLVSQDLDVHFSLQIFAQKFSKLAAIFCLAKNPYYFYKLSELACIVFQNFMQKYLNLLTQMFNIGQKDKNFRNIFNCIVIFFYLFKFKINYQLYESIITGLSLNNNYLKNIIFDFNERFLAILNDGAFFKENFEFLIHLANIIENISDFNQQIINNTFLQSIEYFIVNKSDKQVLRVICGFLSQLDFSTIEQSLCFRVFNILEKLNLEIEDDTIYRDTLIGIKKSFKFTRNNSLVKIFDKLFDQYKKNKCQLQILSLILSLKDSDTNIFFMIINSPQFKEIVDNFFISQCPDIVLLQILNDTIFLKPQFIIDDEFALNYVNFIQKNFFNQEITFELQFLKNIITQYDLFIMIVVKDNIFQEILKFVEFFNKYIKDLPSKNQNQNQNYELLIFIADYHYYLITEIIHQFVNRTFNNDFYSHFIREQIGIQFLDQYDVLIEYSINQKQKLVQLKKFYMGEQFIDEDKINYITLELLSEYRDTHVTNSNQFLIMCRLYCLQKFEKFNRLHPSHQKLFYQYDNYYFQFNVQIDRQQNNIQLLEMQDQKDFLIELKQQLFNLYPNYSQFEINCTIDGNNFTLLDKEEDFYKLAVDQLCTIENNDGKISLGLLLSEIVDRISQCIKCGKLDYQEEMDIVNNNIYCESCMKDLQYKITMFQQLIINLFNFQKIYLTFFFIFII